MFKVVNALKNVLNRKNVSEQIQYESLCELTVSETEEYLSLFMF